MGRLLSFDYTSPFFYMVTLKRRPGFAPFSQITDAPAPPCDSHGRPRYLVASDLTMAYASAIRGFAAKSQGGLWPIETFIVMPDHLHLLLHLQDTGGRLGLAAHVEALAAELSRIYYTMRPDAEGRVYSDLRDSDAAPLENRCFANQSAPSIFAPDWHDWIVMRDGQLAAFTRYIRENPERAWRRRQNRRFFTRPGKLTFAGRDWFSYGNPEILRLPVLEAFRCSRSWERGGPEWAATVARARRIGPGGAGVGTFMSPCEKECGNAIYQTGGSFVVLSPEGFGER
ncbi:MAG: hypothetical protein IKO40_08365, partial [Kiritimatiellae bacterium]|nr:hypothetical protein [Kiritimatiellia bacterium]